MMCNASANLFVDACLNMPTLGVLYKTATLNALQGFPALEGRFSDRRRGNVAR
jgi:hypothetical protein